MTPRLHVGNHRRRLLLPTTVFCALVATAATAQTLGRADNDDVSIWRVVAAFALCVVLAVAAALVLRARLGYLPQLGTGRARRLRLVETLRLGRQVSLSIVACDGEEMLLLSSDQSGQLVRRPRADDTGPNSSEGAP
jgi:anti-sigma-K factor RskA